MNLASLEEDLRRKLLLMQSMPRASPVTFSVARSESNDSVRIEKFPTHDWGVFGEYEYLGAGTPYTAKHRAGIKPRNELDQIAYYHDQQYAWTEKHSMPGTGVITSGARGISDYGAGSAMIVTSLNPWSSLSWKDRLLGLVAGTGLQVQGIFRLTPAGWVVMPAVDKYVYN